MPRPRERVYTLDKQKKHLARLSLLSAKRFRFNVGGYRRVFAFGTPTGSMLCFVFLMTCVGSGCVASMKK